MTCLPMFPTMDNKRAKGNTPSDASIVDYIYSRKPKAGLVIVESPVPGSKLFENTQRPIYDDRFAIKSVVNPDY